MWPTIQRIAVLFYRAHNFWPWLAKARLVPTRYLDRENSVLSAVDSAGITLSYSVVNFPMHCGFMVLPKTDKSRNVQILVIV